MGHGRSGVDIEAGSGKHTQLADPQECHDANPRQAHNGVDDEEGHHGSQPQGQQVPCSVACQRTIKSCQSVGESLLQRFTDQVPTEQESDRGPAR